MNHLKFRPLRGSHKAPKRIEMYCTLCGGRKMSDFLMLKSDVQDFGATHKDCPQPREKVPVGENHS